MEILIPILAVTVIGLICAVGLAVASSVMAVKEDTRFTEIRACLPGANCGACGYTGCDGYAKALLEPGTKTNLCVPGADAVAAQIAALLDMDDAAYDRADSKLQQQAKALADAKAAADKKAKDEKDAAEKDAAAQEKAAKAARSDARRQIALILRNGGTVPGDLWQQSGYSAVTIAAMLRGRKG